MAASTVNFQQITLELSEVADVVITDIAQDPDVGDYVRVINFMGAAFVGGPQDLILQIKIRSSSQSNIDISAPPQKF
jgi:hypothetical protein